jgi:hypothetical protein
MNYQLYSPEPDWLEIADVSRFLAAEIYVFRLSSRLFLRFSLDVRRVLTFEVSHIVLCCNQINYLRRDFLLRSLSCFILALRVLRPPFVLGVTPGMLLG